MTARLFRLLVLGLAMLPFEAALAYADDGPPQTLLSAAGRLRPTETIERVAAPGVVKVLVSVPGYMSDPADTSYWQRLYDATPEYRHVGLGRDIGTYDTRGSVAVSGDALRRSVQRLVTVDDVDAVALVGVSQGGNVIKASVRSGLSSRDNLTTITTLSSPLNGSTTARVIRAADSVATLLGVHDQLRWLVKSLFGADVEDAALAELEQPDSFTPPPHIGFTQFYITGDLLVSSRDATVPGAMHRNLTPFLLEAHGGQINDPRTLPPVVDAIRGKDVTAPTAESTIAELLAPPADGLRDRILLGLAILFVSAAVVLGALEKVVAAAKAALDKLDHALTQLKRILVVSAR